MLGYIDRPDVNSTCRSNHQSYMYRDTAGPARRHLICNTPGDLPVTTLPTGRMEPWKRTSSPNPGSQIVDAATKRGREQHRARRQRSRSPCNALAAPSPKLLAGRREKVRQVGCTVITPAPVPAREGESYEREGTEAAVPS